MGYTNLFNKKGFFYSYNFSYKHSLSGRKEAFHSSTRHFLAMAKPILKREQFWEDSDIYQKLNF